MEIELEYTNAMYLLGDLQEGTAYQLVFIDEGLVFSAGPCSSCWCFLRWAFITGSLKVSPLYVYKDR